MLFQYLRHLPMTSLQTLSLQTSIIPVSLGLDPMLFCYRKMKSQACLESAKFR